MNVIGSHKVEIEKTFAQRFAPTRKRPGHTPSDERKDLRDSPRPLNHQALRTWTCCWWANNSRKAPLASMIETSHARLSSGRDPFMAGINTR